MRSKFLGEHSVVGPASDSRYVITKLVSKLNSQMTQAANALHCDQVTGQGTTVPQRIVGSDSGAKQRCRLGVTQSFRYGDQRFYGSDHVLLVSAVIADARNLHIP